MCVCVFQEIIHNSKQLTQTQKLHYLRSSLFGQAVDTVQAIELSESNYEIAWDLLCKGFDNKRVLVRNHVKAILELGVTKEDSAKELRQLVDGISMHTMALKALGQNVDAWGVLIIFIITAKLDDTTKRK